MAQTAIGSIKSEIWNVDEKEMVEQYTKNALK